MRGNFAALPKSGAPRSIAAMKDEIILVVRRALFDELGAFQGLNFEIDRYLPALLARENNFFTPRPPAETDPTLKQIIPYVLLVHEGRVLHYVRGKKAGYLLGKNPLQRAHRRPRRALRAARDQIRDCLRLHQIQFAVQKRALGKLAGAR